MICNPEDENRLSRSTEIKKAVIEFIEEAEKYILLGLHDDFSTLLTVGRREALKMLIICDEIIEKHIISELEKREVKMNEGISLKKKKSL